MEARQLRIGLANDNICPLGKWLSLPPAEPDVLLVSSSLKNGQRQPLSAPPDGITIPTEGEILDLFSPLQLSP